jgi:thioredoxin-like negative regulator of GroEL
VLVILAILLVSWVAARGRRPAAAVGRCSAAGGDQKVRVSGQKVRVTNYNTTWCGHSRAFQPVWDQLSREFVGRVDMIDRKCDDADCSAEYGALRGFPTVVVTSGANTAEYEGNRSIGDLRRFIQRHL